MEHDCIDYLLRALPGHSSINTHLLWPDYAILTCELGVRLFKKTWNHVYVDVRPSASNSWVFLSRKEKKKKQEKNMGGTKLISQFFFLFVQIITSDAKCFYFNFIALGCARKSTVLPQGSELCFQSKFQFELKLENNSTET